MSIKILSGKARGVSLATPPSIDTRPTSVLLKRRVFDANQDISENTFVDLCAGVGTVGLEALSRGVKELVLVEKAPKVVNILKKNLALVQQKAASSKASIVKMDAIQWLAQHRTQVESMDKGIIYLDPPYEELDIYQKIITVLREFSYPGQVWSEACRQKTMHEDDFMQKFYAGKVYRQGTSYIVIGTLKEN